MASSAKSNTGQISAQITKSLKCLNDTEELMNNIFAYCGQLYKQEPTEQSIKTIQSYLLDNVNTVGEHIFGVSRRVESLFNAQLEELDHLQSEMTSINHRLTSAEGFISNAFMLKFRGLPRKPIPILVKSQVLPAEKLPRASKKRKPWTRQKEIDYTILDQLGANPSGHRASEILDPEGAGSGMQSQGSRPSYMNYQNPAKRTSLRQPQQGVNSAPPKLSQNPSNSAIQQPLQAPPQLSSPPPSLSSRGPGAASPAAPNLSSRGPGAASPASPGAPPAGPGAPPSGPGRPPSGPGAMAPPPGPGRPPAGPGAPPAGPGRPPAGPGAMAPPPGPGRPPAGPGAPPPGPGGPPPGPSAGPPPGPGGPPRGPPPGPAGGPPPGPGGPPPGPPGRPPVAPGGGMDVSGPEYDRFKKMMKFGVPKASIASKLEQNGLNPDAVNYF